MKGCRKMYTHTFDENNRCNSELLVGQGKKRIMTRNYILLSRTDHIYVSSLWLNTATEIGW